MPCLCGIENLIWNTRTLDRHAQVEDVQILVFGLGERSVVNGIQDGPSVFKWTTLSTLGDRSAYPTRIYEPSVGLVISDLFGKHLCIAGRMENEERLTEAGRESGLGRGNTLFRTSHLGGIAGDEVVHDLVVVEFRDRWEDTASIASQEDDVGWV